MNFGVSHYFHFERRIYMNDGLYMLQIKIPYIIKNFYYQIVGTEQFFYTGQSVNFMEKENKKEDSSKKDKIGMPTYLLFGIPMIQDLFFQIRIIQNEKMIDYHDFIDMNELFKDLQIPQIKKNIKLNVEENQSFEEEKKNDKKEEDKDEDDEDEYDEDDEDDEDNEEDEDEEDEEDEKDKK